ncbi:hypothetical protein LINPERHAP1_LOCUS21170 [Linum perenne]
MSHLEISQSVLVINYFARTGFQMEIM